MLTWTREKPDAPGWYWILSPGHHSNLPTVIQIVFDVYAGRWLALIPPCQDPRHPGKEVELQQLDAVWAGPLEVPSVLPKESSGVLYDRMNHPVIVT